MTYGMPMKVLITSQGRLTRGTKIFVRHPGSSSEYEVRNLACENNGFSSLFTAGEVSRGKTSATQRQKFHTDDVKSARNPSEALIGRRSSYIVLTIVYE